MTDEDSRGTHISIPVKKFKPVATFLLLAGMMLVGGIAAAPAGATQLCGSTDCEIVYGSGQVLEASLVESTSTTFSLGGLGTASCSGSTWTGKTTASSGKPLPGEITGLTFSGCKVGETSCTIKALNLPYKAVIEETGGGNGTLKISSGGSGNPGAEANCGFTCAATISEATLTVEGGEAAVARLKEAKLKRTNGFLCPETISWSAEYMIASPQQMEVGQAPTLLCKTAPNAAGECTKTDAYEGPVEGKLANGTALFTQINGGDVTCAKVGFKGDYGKTARGTVNTLTFEGAAEVSCSSTIPGAAKVTVTTSKTSTDSFFEWRPITTTQGTFSFKWLTEKFVIGKTTCNYDLNLNQVPYARVANAGASETSVTVTNMRLITKDAGCTQFITASFTLAINRVNANVYVAKTLAP